MRRINRGGTKGGRGPCPRDRHGDIAHVRRRQRQMERHPVIYDPRMKKHDDRRKDRKERRNYLHLIVVCLVLYNAAQCNLLSINVMYCKPISCDAVKLYTVCFDKCSFLLSPSNVRHSIIMLGVGVCLAQKLLRAYAFITLFTYVHAD